MAFGVVQIMMLDSVTTTQRVLSCVNAQNIYFTELKKFLSIVARALLIKKKLRAKLEFLYFLGKGEKNKNL